MSALRQFRLPLKCREKSPELEISMDEFNPPII
jgi:hypothetical protein